MRVLPLALLTACLALGGCINSHDNSGNPGNGAADVDNSADVTSTASSAREGGTHSINGSIHISAGHPGGEVTTINGSIRADDNAQLAGGHTVNGGISLGDHATATSLTTVNGGVTVGIGAHVSGTVTTVNGTLVMHSGSEVDGRLSNVNGTIILANATVGGGIATVNGNIDIGANSHVKGGIVVHKPTMAFFNWGGDNDKPRVVVGPGAVIDGPLRFERAVRLYVSDTATIGPVTGATPVKFSGDRPPSS